MLPVPEAPSVRTPEPRLSAWLAPVLVILSVKTFVADESLYAAQMVDL